MPLNVVLRNPIFVRLLNPFITSNLLLPLIDSQPPTLSNFPKLGIVFSRLFLLIVKFPSTAVKASKPVIVTKLP